MNGDVRTVKTLTGEVVRVVEVSHDVGGSRMALLALADELGEDEWVGALHVASTPYDETEFILTAWVHA